MDAGRRWHALGLCAIPLACAAAYLADPAEGGIFPPCPFRTVTGYDCPGCGSARAMHEITHGRIAEAFTLNPLLVIVLPLIIYAVAAATAYVLRGRPLRLPTAPPWAALATVAAVAVFGVTRNLPLDAVAWMASYR